MAGDEAGLCLDILVLNHPWYEVTLGRPEVEICITNSAYAYA